MRGLTADKAATAHVADHATDEGRMKRKLCFWPIGALEEAQIIVRRHAIALPIVTDENHARASLLPNAWSALDVALLGNTHHLPMHGRETAADHTSTKRVISMRANGWPKW